jgi:hypothetical protein
MFDFFGDVYSDHGWFGLVGAIVLILAVVFGILCLETWLAMALWNGCAVPAVAVLNEVGFWQMWGITLLCNILFKSVHNSKSKKE